MGCTTSQSTDHSKSRTVNDVTRVPTPDEYSLMVVSGGHHDPIRVHVFDFLLIMSQWRWSWTLVQLFRLCQKTFFVYTSHTVLEESSARLKTYSGKLLTVQGIVYLKLMLVTKSECSVAHTYCF